MAKSELLKLLFLKNMRLKNIFILSNFIIATLLNAVELRSDIDFTDIFEKNICNFSHPISLTYSIEHIKSSRDYDYKKVSKQLPDANYEFTTNGHDKHILSITSCDPIYNGKPYNGKCLTIGDSSVLYLENINRVIILKKGENNQMPQVFWEYLTLLPGDSLMERGKPILEMLEEFTSNGKLTADRKENGQRMLEYRLPSTKIDGYELSPILSLLFKYIDGKLYPLSIKVQTLKKDPNANLSMSPPKIEIKYSSYVRLENSGVYIPKLTEIKRANLYYPNNDITGTLKNDIICWIIIKVKDATDDEKIINERLKFKIPSEAIIEDKNNSEKLSRKYSGDNLLEENEILADRKVKRIFKDDMKLVIEDRFKESRTSYTLWIGNEIKAIKTVRNGVKNGN